MQSVFRRAAIQLMSWFVLLALVLGMVLALTCLMVLFAFVGSRPATWLSSALLAVASAV